jgi:hypothetical protein
MNDIFYNHLPPCEKTQKECVQAHLIPIMGINSIYQSFIINNKYDFHKELKLESLNQDSILIDITALFVIKNSNVKAIVFVFDKNKSRVALTITACDSQVWNK